MATITSAMTIVSNMIHQHQADEPNHPIVGDRVIEGEGTS